MLFLFHFRFTTIPLNFYLFNLPFSTLKVFNSNFLQRVCSRNPQVTFRYSLQLKSKELLTKIVIRIKSDEIFKRKIKIVPFFYNRTD